MKKYDLGDDDCMEDADDEDSIKEYTILEDDRTLG